MRPASSALSTECRHIVAGGRGRRSRGCGDTLRIQASRPSAGESPFGAATRGRYRSRSSAAMLPSMSSSTFTALRKVAVAAVTLPWASIIRIRRRGGIGRNRSLRADASFQSSASTVRLRVRASSSPAYGLRHSAHSCASSQYRCASLRQALHLRADAEAPSPQTAQFAVFPCCCSAKSWARVATDIQSFPKARTSGSVRCSRTKASARPTWSTPTTAAAAAAAAPAAAAAVPVAGEATRRWLITLGRDGCPLSGLQDPRLRLQRKFFALRPPLAARWR